MKLLEVTTAHPETGEHHLDPNKIVDLLIKVVAVVGTVLAIRASNQANQNQQKLQSQQHFLNVDRGSNYVATVEHNAVNQQRRK